MQATPPMNQSHHESSDIVMNRTFNITRCEPDVKLHLIDNGNPVRCITSVTRTNLSSLDTTGSILLVPYAYQCFQD